MKILHSPGRIEKSASEGWYGNVSSLVEEEGRYLALVILTVDGDAEEETEEEEDDDDDNDEDEVISAV